jgi:hypothetical protein
MTRAEIIDTITCCAIVAGWTYYLKTGMPS